ncbi:hypothetical protein [Sporosarcina thermotolerans]|uniref:hypothetical protein n=1 Tax=Sporosarcina thermotolerans TaxID=633404 RepID=UPI0036D2A8BB
MHAWQNNALQAVFSLEAKVLLELGGDMLELGVVLLEFDVDLLEFGGVMLEFEQVLLVLGPLTYPK